MYESKVARPVGILAISLLLAACGGGGGGGSASTGTASEGSNAIATEVSQLFGLSASGLQIAFVLPTSTSTWSTGEATLDVSGGAVLNSEGTARVTWVNRSGGSGSAQTSQYKTSMLWTAASIPLVVGTNQIVVTVTDASGATVERTLTVTRSGTTLTSTAGRVLPALLQPLQPAFLYARSDASAACPERNVTEAFHLPTRIDATAGSVVTQCFTVKGLVTGQSATLTTAVAQHSVNSGAYKAAGVASAISNGDTVRLKLTASSTIDAKVNESLTLSVNGVQSRHDWTVRTRNSDRAARTWYVGPTRTMTQLTDVVSQLQAGDTVLVDPGVYQPVKFNRSGAADAPITIKGTGTTRPVIRGTSSDAYKVTLNLVEANHYLIENIEVDGGTTDPSSSNASCVRAMADVVVLRDVYVHDCPRHGILGSDFYTGTVVLDRVEVTRAGAPARSGENSKHAIYVATDRDRFPGSVLRVMNSYLHDFEGTGIKSRSERAEIYYNWVETKEARAQLSNETQASTLYSVELYGFEEYPGESTVTADVAGNVLAHRGAYGLRLGSDGSGVNLDRVVFANNTVLAGDGLGSSTPLFRLFKGLESVYLLNNTFVRVGSQGQTAIRLFRDDIEASGWSAGQPQVAGSNNWMPAGSDIRLYAAAPSASSYTPALAATTTASSNPGHADLQTWAGLNLQLSSGSSLLSGGRALNGTLGTAYEVAQRLTSLAFAVPSARPAEGAKLAAASRTSTSVPMGAAFRASTTVPTYALSVARVGSGTVTSDKGGINCGSSCSASVESGVTVKLQATPASGWQMGSWTGCSRSSGTSCEVDVSRAASVTATFTQVVTTTPSTGGTTSPTRYTLTVTTSGSGTVVSDKGAINCGSACAVTVDAGTTVNLSAQPATGYTVTWAGCSTSSGNNCSVAMNGAATVRASFAALPTSSGSPSVIIVPVGSGSSSSTTPFSSRPYLLKSIESRLKASVSSGQAIAVGSGGFLDRVKTAVSSGSEVPNFYVALAGMAEGNASLLKTAHDRVMALVNANPAGDSGRGTNFKDVDYRMFETAAVVDMAYSQFTTDELTRVATWVNGTLDNWNYQNKTFWPFDDSFNNYWQNGFLGHVIAGIATQGFNPRAAEWRATAGKMYENFKAASAKWSGPIQAEGNYYSSYVSQVLWAMELHDGAMGTTWVAGSKLNAADYLDFLMFQLRPNLKNYFVVGSQPSEATAPFTHSTIWYWQHLIHSAAGTNQARYAKAILDPVLVESFAMSRLHKSFVQFYWNTSGLATADPATNPSRMYVAPTPGAGLIGLRSSAGFRTDATAVVMFANTNGDGGRAGEPARWSHGNPDAPGFQWASGADWLVTDPDFYSRNGLLAEAGSAYLSDLSNIVTLAGVKENGSVGSFPLIKHAENNTSAAVPHFYTQIDAQPYWNMTSTYRREYVWLDDLQVVVIADRIVGSQAKTWRLHVPAAPVISGNTATYTINGKQVRVRDLTNNGAWSSVNLNGSVTVSNVWRLSQTASATDYTSVKVLDVGGRAVSATLTSGAGYVQANVNIGGINRTVRFYADGSHALVQ